MENRFLCKDCDNPSVRALSDELTALGYEGAEYYYQNGEGGVCFFKLPFTVFTTDGVYETLHIFVDVMSDGEYKVQGYFIHDHFPDAKSAAEHIRDLKEKTLAEVGISFGSRDLHAAFFIKNTGDPKQNILYFWEHAEELLSTILAFEGRVSPSMHVHYACALAEWTANKRRNLYVGSISSDEVAIIGEQGGVYLSSAVIGEQPEFFSIPE